MGAALFFGGTMSSCSDKKVRTDEKEGAMELRLPEIPASIATPEEEIDYLALHFWENLDMRDTLQTRNGDFMEQNFSNYLSILPYASPEVRKGSVATFLKSMRKDPPCYFLIEKLADSYLYDPNSPFYSEETYILFMEEYAASPLLEDYRRERYGARLEDALKNRPGSVAPDFEFITRGGEKINLHSLKNDSPLLLIFYDPECEHCHDILTALSASEQLRGLAQNGSLQVMAIYSGENRELWNASAPQLPDYWTVGYENGRIEEEELYVFRSLPVLYILDTDKRVLYKDAAPEEFM